MSGARTIRAALLLGAVAWWAAPWLSAPAQAQSLLSVPPEAWGAKLSYRPPPYFGQSTPAGNWMEPEPWPELPDTWRASDSAESVSPQFPVWDRLADVSPAAGAPPAGYGGAGRLAEPGPLTSPAASVSAEPNPGGAPAWGGGLSAMRGDAALPSPTFDADADAESGMRSDSEAERALAAVIPRSGTMEQSVGSYGQAERDSAAGPQPATPYEMWPVGGWGEDDEEVVWGEAIGDKPAAAPPEVWADPVMSGSIGGAAQWVPEPPWMSGELGRLFAMVDAGEGHEAYPLLVIEGDAALALAEAEGRDATELRKRLLIYLLRAGDGLEAPEARERTAREFTDSFPDDEHFPLAFVYLIEALYLQGKELETSFFFDEAAEIALPVWMRARYRAVLADAAERSGDYLAQAEHVLAQEGLGLRPPEEIREEVEAALEQVEGPEVLADFLLRHGEVAWLRERGPLLRVRALINQGDLARALIEVNRIEREGAVNSPAVIKAVHAARLDIEAAVLIRPERVGVLLPLSSSSAALRALALETLDGLRMALEGRTRAPQPLAPGAHLALAMDPAPGLNPVGANGAHPAPSFELVIRDTGNSPARAAEQVRELVVEEQVIAIIGPVARSESTAAAEQAETMGVPLISLSLTMEIPAGSEFVFRHSKSQEEEVRDLVRYAMDYGGARRFAILYPDTGIGTRLMELFWGEVMRQGGHVVGAEAYRTWREKSDITRQEVGLKEIFERFTGLNRPQTPEELALLEAAGDTKPDPIVDFDAMFVPIGPTGSQDLRLIAPYPPTVDAEQVMLLGNRFWNSDEVLVAADGKLNGAIFVDAYDRKSATPVLRDFRRRHRILFGHRANYSPASYYTAFAYDTLNLLMAVVAEHGADTREAVADTLATMQPYSGVSGLTTFLENGEAVKETMFFRLQGDDIRRVIP